jgi:hypothetical protein
MTKETKANKEDKKSNHNHKDLSKLYGEQAKPMNNDMNNNNNKNLENTNKNKESSVDYL